MSTTDKVYECVVDADLDGDGFSDIPSECRDLAYSVILDIVELDSFRINRENENEYAADLCRTIIGSIDEAVKNSSKSVPEKHPDRAYTELCIKVLSTHRPTLLPPGPTFAPRADEVAEQYPCGDGDGRRVLCASPTLPAGDTVSMAMIMTGAIPLADPMYIHQFAFVFDSDADPNNNYRASTEYPNDFFDSTDRWYVASYTPQDGWGIQVSTASGSTITPASSAARIVIDGHAMMLFVPAGELATSCPPYRMTAFTHLGDYGQDPPHNWSGDVEPAVAQPLETRCFELTGP